MYYCKKTTWLANSIRPLSGTSSFSNGTVWFTRFFVYNGNRISHFFFGLLKFDKQSLPSSCIPLYYSEIEKNQHLSLRLLCLQSATKHTAIVANVNKCTVTTSGSQWHCVT